MGNTAGKRIHTSRGPVAGEGLPVDSVVKNLPSGEETWVQFLGQDNALEKEMATHSSIFAWKISWTEEPGGLQSMGSQRVRPD